MSGYPQAEDPHNYGSYIVFEHEVVCVALRLAVIACFIRGTAV
jgi:hypothetical protein